VFLGKKYIFAPPPRPPENFALPWKKSADAHGHTLYRKTFPNVLNLTSSGYHLISIVSGEQTLEEKAEMFSQLGKLPLAKNPFFIKSIANSGQFDGEGTEGMTPGNSLLSLATS